MAQIPLLERAKRVVGRYDYDGRFLGADFLWQIGNSVRLILARKRQLERSIPDIWQYDNVLYVGARESRIDFGREFRRNNYQIDVLEVFRPNVDFLKEVAWLNQVYQGDVRQVDEVIGQEYDIVFWWHGPEHIDKAELKETLRRTESVATKLIVCGCPWGVYEQEEAYGNPFEEHRAHLLPEDFACLGYEVSAIGREGFFGSNIIAWKRLAETFLQT